MSSLPDPAADPADAAQLLLEYLDFFRAEILRKLEGLSSRNLRAGRLPSGWSPLELLSHLVHMERRWLVWGFAGEPVHQPWGDSEGSGRWSVPAYVTLDELAEQLLAGGRRTTEIVATARLGDHAAVGGRFDREPTPTLARILFHVLQEYARHAGHLDIARELVDGLTGEDPYA